MVGHSADGTESWLNWIVSDATGAAPDYVQATARQGVSEFARVAAPAAQSRGVATGRANAVLSWLRSEGGSQFVAHNHPDHAASEAVVRHLGLTPTTTGVDGERRRVS
ncbi:GNAT family N-acetyltransferase [Subtercola boreus]|nr:GNAT family N-acetyltransferase [Subtercola boreus]RFA20873.1 hypothetical protein B7R23_08210 [Subtercola boreus]RFA20989.1 hypothetical protein B7R24_08270 [Subtercola boreus]